MTRLYKTSTAFNGNAAKTITKGKGTLLLLLLTLLTLSCSHGTSKMSRADHKGSDKGLASWYGEKFHGKLTASGETYNMHSLTAAHRTLPLGTTLKVTNLGNGKSINVTVNDRGPFVRGRILDLSYEGARRLDFIDKGTTKVRIKVTGRDERYKKYIRVAKGVKGGEEVKRKERYIIQVASFRDFERAKRLKESLSWNYRSVYLEKKRIRKKTYYRVKLGAFKGLKKARLIGERLAHEGFDVLILKR